MEIVPETHESHALIKSSKGKTAGYKAQRKSRQVWLLKSESQGPFMHGICQAPLSKDSLREPLSLPSDEINRN
jgi:hypothetical protein